MPRLRLRYSFLLSVAALALIFGGIAAIALRAGSSPVVALAGEQVDQVESADEVARKDVNCFLFNNELICIPKLAAKAGQPTLGQVVPSAAAVSSLQAFSSEPSPGGGRPSMAIIWRS